MDACLLDKKEKSNELLLVFEIGQIYTHHKFPLNKFNKNVDICYNEEEL